MGEAPKRIQRSRAKGWRMPPNTVSVARPGPWGNPFSARGARQAGFTGTDAHIAGMCCGMFRNAMLARLPVVNAMPDRLHELRGKNLACWCPPAPFPCHADILLELANA